MTKERILVTGANGWLGRAVVKMLEGRCISGLRHLDGSKNAILIDSNGVVEKNDLSGISGIINCAGLVNGTVNEITQANVVYPTALAQAARSAGVSRFVQVSSFSIFGRAEYIENDQLIAPADIYGRSKLAVERSLHALNSPDFSTVSLRLPFMFSAEHPAHLGRFVSAMLRLRALPILRRQPSRRSMITYAGAAEALTMLATNSLPHNGSLAAADVDPLELVVVAQALRERLGCKIAILPVPRAVVEMANMAAPTFVNRLFGSCVLSPSANMITGGLANSVHAELHRYLDNLPGYAATGHRDGN